LKVKGNRIGDRREMEYRNTGMMEYWNNGNMEYWSIGVLEETIQNANCKREGMGKRNTGIRSWCAGVTKTNKWCENEYFIGSGVRKLTCIR
jgi:hypothetical protein